MTTLHQLIERAVENGYTPYSKNIPQVSEDLRDKFVDTIVRSILKDKSLNDILFDQEFARACFGEEEVSIRLNDTLYESSDPEYSTLFIGKSWQYHLTQLAIAPDRLEYLAKWLEEKK